MSEAKLLFNPRAPVSDSDLVAFVRKRPELEDHLLFQSSGTTGTPKWVALSRAALRASAEGVNTWLAVEPRDVFALALPTFHVGGYGLAERARVAECSLLDFGEVSKKWNAQLFADWMGKSGATLSSLVPAQVYDLVKARIVAPASVRAIVVGGGALNPALYAEARGLKWPLLISYGLSECASQLATAALSSLTSLEFPRAYLLPHFSARQVAAERAIVAGRSLLTAYVLKIDGVWRVFDPKQAGRFELPDKVELAAEAQFVAVAVSGRRGEEYKIMGEWIELAKIKQHLQTLAFRRGLFTDVEVAVLPDERRGNCVALICEKLNPPVRSLVNEFNQLAVPFERITHICETPLPRSDLGKILVSKINPVCLQEYSG